MTKQEIPTFALRLPPVSTRKVWVGIYSDMGGTVVMIFRRKPKIDKYLGYYPSTDENRIASMWIEEWEHWFGTCDPFVESGLIEWREDMTLWVACSSSKGHLDCYKVIQINLTCCWNEDGTPIGLNVYADQ